MLFLVDLDGVCADFTGGIIDKMAATTQYELEEQEVNQFYIASVYEKKHGEDAKTKVMKHMHEPGFIRNLKPISGAREALKELQKNGHRVEICTSPIQTNTCAKEKREWVKEHLGEYTVHVVHDKSLVDGDFLIDDRERMPQIKDKNQNPSWKHLLYKTPATKTVWEERGAFDWNSYKQVISKEVKEKEKEKEKEKVKKRVQEKEQEKEPTSECISCSGKIVAAIQDDLIPEDHMGGNNIMKELLLGKGNTVSYCDAPPQSTVKTVRYRCRADRVDISEFIGTYIEPDRYLISQGVKVYIAEGKGMVRKNTKWVPITLDINLNANLHALGIGGMNGDYVKIIRRAFATRTTSFNYGIPHSRGMILYGPPGTGKTLFARNLGKIFGTVAKVLTTSDLTCSYWGGSEKKIDAIFDIVYEFPNSFHFIVLDEIDALFSKRASSNDNDKSDAFRSGKINQFLTRLDGFDGVNNVFVLGMTNRFNILDPALLRPGRLEFHIEFSIPDYNARLEILEIHTRKLVEQKLLNVDLAKIAAKTVNYVGADLEGVVRSAINNSLAEYYESASHQEKARGRPPQVDQKHFDLAVSESKPRFGDKMPLVPSPTQNQLITSKFTRGAHLITGRISMGKSTAGMIWATQQRPHLVRIITPADLLGKKIEEMLPESFKEMKYSKRSIMILDDIDDYPSIREMRVLVKKYKGDCLIIGTCEIEFAKKNHLYDLFDTIKEIKAFHKPTTTSSDEPRRVYGTYPAPKHLI